MDVEQNGAAREHTGSRRMLVTKCCGESRGGSYLSVPVWCGQPLARVTLTVDGVRRVLELPVPPGTEEAGGEPDYMAAIPLEGGADATHTFCIESEKPLRASFFLSFDCVDRPSPPGMHPRFRPDRPRLHFAPAAGWLNDPNGMVFYNGEYHLYFQYNPFNTEWQNMSWGHAVSRDLLHWEQRDTVMFPDDRATMFSGSGIVNGHGMLRLPADALLFFYTYADGARLPQGSPLHFDQRIAYSVDGGSTFRRLDGAFLPYMTPDARDPKVFYHGQTGAYICVLWLEGNTFAIFRSRTLEDWEETQRITFPPAWECPDLFELDCLAEDGTPSGEKMWVFWSAGGDYLVGRFDGGTFTQVQDVRHAYATALPYAAQTFSNTPGKVISIAWLRMKNEGKPYRGAMSLPRELALVKKEGGYVVALRPAEQYAASRAVFFRADVAGGAAALRVPGGAWELELRFAPGAAVSVSARGAPFLAYNGETGVLSFAGEDVPLGVTTCLRCLVDDDIVEVATGDATGIAYMECAPLGAEALAVSASGGAYTVAAYSAGAGYGDD